MSKKQYLAERKRIAAGTLLKADLSQDDTLNRTFNFVSANLLNFLPGIPADTHEALFSQMLMHQQLSMLDYHHPDALNQVRTEGAYEDAIALLKNRPAIICTFHMGSNRVLNHMLAAAGIPFTVVAANHIARGEGEAFSQMYAREYNRQQPFTVIEAQQPNAGLQMLRELKKGRSLLIYIDGNTGSGDDTIHNENRTRIDFLNGHIYARSGVAYLSHLANVPVIPVVSYRTSLNCIRLRIEQAIYPDTTVSRKQYAATATQQIYNAFAPLLQQYPEQWECWMYLHKMVDCKAFTGADAVQQDTHPATGAFHLNKSRYGVFNIGNEWYLFHKQSYTSYPVNRDIYQLLFKSFSNAVQREEISSQVFEQLYAHKVFIQA
ncbi:lauroyl/myristoyl acyltransferase [Filimonas zeae]|nr:hypothetical protein [Filimonas zeae]MDR6339626.1 lauroyl/myristoyl acyltransferase [Filimonas zeae]